MNRNLIYPLLYLLLPAQLLAQAPSISVPLESVDTYLPKSYNQVGTTQSTDFAAFKGVPDFLVDKVIRSANTVRGQNQFEAYQKGKLTADEWKKAKASCGRDTVGLSPTPLRHRINALVGTDRQGRRVVIVDANNNQDFGDDQVLYYPMTLPAIEKNKSGHYANTIHAVYDTLPVVRVQLEAFDGKKIVSRAAWVKPNPYNSGWTYPDSLQHQFHLALLASEYRKGSAVVQGQPVYFTVTSGVAGLPYNTQATTVKISQNAPETTRNVPESVFSREQDVYKIGQSFILNNRRIQITGASMAGDRLYLADVGPAGNIISRPAEK